MEVEEKVEEKDEKDEKVEVLLLLLFLDRKVYIFPANGGDVIVVM